MHIKLFCLEAPFHFIFHLLKGVVSEGGNTHKKKTSKQTTNDIFYNVRAEHNTFVISPRAFVAKKNKQERKEGKCVFMVDCK